MSDQSIREGNTPEALRHEYSEACGDLRNHANLRFTIFTVYLAALGGLASIAFGFIESKFLKPETSQLWGRLGGLLVTLLFFYYELRIQSLVNHDLETAKNLEGLLNYNHFRSRPSWGAWRSHYATNIFFIVVIVFWAIMGYRAF